MITGLLLVGIAVLLGLGAAAFIVWAIRRWDEEAAVIAFIAVGLLASFAFHCGKEGVDRLDKWEASQTGGR